ncbi:MAG: hypothetical protein JST84_33810 [Acidobacteria bacterium]|nr:hypothetical protein [Acidobacteriota bacterium]
MPFSFCRLSTRQLLALCVVLLGTVTALGLSSRRWLTNTKEMKAVAPSAVQAKNKANPLGNGYLQRKGMWPQLRPTLDAHGDRFEKPGKERVTIVGIINDLASDDKTPSRLIFEFPDKLRLEKQKKDKVHITIFDGKTKFKLGDVLKKEEEDELESLALDSADHFLAGHMQGFTTRFFGARFRLDDGTVRDYKGPFYDIYQLTDQIPHNNNEKREQYKRYFINSDSQLIERITYQTKSNGKDVDVTVQYSGWQIVEGQQLPTTITRLENGKTTMILSISAASLSRRADDGIFTNPQGK